MANYECGLLLVHPPGDAAPVGFWDALQARLGFAASGRTLDGGGVGGEDGRGSPPDRPFTQADCGLLAREMYAQAAAEAEAEAAEAQAVAVPAGALQLAEGQQQARAAAAHADGTEAIAELNDEARYEVVGVAEAVRWRASLPEGRAAQHSYAEERREERAEVLLLPLHWPPA